MNLEKVIFGFFVLLALTINFGFVMGDIDNPDHHHAFELFLALVVSIIATIMKLGDRSHIGAVLLATSLVADFHLIAAAVIWAFKINVAAEAIADPGTMAAVVSLAGGALIANFASVALLLIETATIRR